MNTFLGFLLGVSLSLGLQGVWFHSWDYGIGAIIVIAVVLVVVSVAINDA